MQKSILLSIGSLVLIFAVVYLFTVLTLDDSPIQKPNATLNSIKITSPSQNQTSAKVTSASKHQKSIKNRCDIEIVVAYYMENFDETLRTIKSVRSALGCGNVPVKIYNKGQNNLSNHDNITIIRLTKNVGREGHTYLHHIVKNYDNLSSKTIFIQAKLHFADFTIRALKEVIFNTTGYAPLTPWLRCDNCLYVASWFNRFVNTFVAFMTGKFLTFEPSINWNGQFVVSSSRIQKIPLEKYQNFLDLFELPEESEIFSKVDLGIFGKDIPNMPLLGHSLERSWSSLFGCNDRYLAEHGCGGENFFANPKHCTCQDTI